MIQGNVIFITAIDDRGGERLTSVMNLVILTYA